MACSGALWSMCHPVTEGLVSLLQLYYLTENLTHIIVTVLFPPSPSVPSLPCRTSPPVISPVPCCEGYLDEH